MYNNNNAMLPILIQCWTNSLNKLTIAIFIKLIIVIGIVPLSPRPSVNDLWFW